MKTESRAVGAGVAAVLVEARDFVEFLTGDWDGSWTPAHTQTERDSCAASSLDRYLLTDPIYSACSEEMTI
jgi:hypothetical protein